MQSLREVARVHLARSLRRLEDEDRLSMALPATCGSALAAHCAVAHLNPAGTLHLAVDGAEWMDPLRSMREQLRHDLQRVAGVPLAEVHFNLVKTAARVR